MPSALSFKNSSELVTKLRLVNWTERIDEIHADREDLGALTAIFDAVVSSTFRAFRSYKDNKPSEVFRACVSEMLFNCGLSELQKVASNDEYRVWALRLARRLDKKWEEQLNEGLERPER